MKQIEINSQQYHLSASSTQEARYVSYISSNYKNSHTHLATDT